jgi:hypothetical protein
VRRRDIYLILKKDAQESQQLAIPETKISIHTPEQNALIEAGKMYAGMTHTKHPKASPLYGDLLGLAAFTLFMGPMIY